jgi:hypothetical protein
MMYISLSHLKQIFQFNYFYLIHFNIILHSVLGLLVERIPPSSRTQAVVTSKAYRTILRRIILSENFSICCILHEIRKRPCMWRHQSSVIPLQTTYFPKFLFNVLLPYHSRFSKWPLSKRSVNQNAVCIVFYPNPTYAPSQSPTNFLDFTLQ